MKHTFSRASVAALLFATLATISVGCGEKETATESGGAGTSSAKPGATPALSTEAQSAMQAQQKSDSEGRAAHAPPAPK